MHYLSSVSIVKNEKNYIFDFVEIHRKLGVEHFLFFDRSDEPLSELFKGEKDIEVIHFPEPNRHHYAWAEGVKHLQGKSRWVQFIDIDQVTVPMKTNDIKVMLQDYEDCPALGLNWHSFGSNGRDKPYYTAGPKSIGLATGQTFIDTYSIYTKRSTGDRWINNHIQSIVQIDKCETRPWGTPHNAPMKEGQIIFNTNRIGIGSCFSSPPVQDVAFIAHYYTRSREEWSKKVAKGRADVGYSVEALEQTWIEGLAGEKVDLNQAVFDIHNSYLNEVEDLTVANIWRK